MQTTATDTSLILPVPPRVEKPVPRMNVQSIAFAVLAMGLALATTPAAASVAMSSRVHPGVHRTLRRQGTVDVIVTFETTALESVREAAFTTRSAKIDDLRKKLQAQHAATRSEVAGVLSEERSSLHGGYESFWISNQVLVSAASFEAVEKLAELGSVRSIREQATVKLDVPASLNATTGRRGLQVTQTAISAEWGVSMIGANRVWADGVTGEGVVVANIDSGVRGTHEVLRSNFRGAYGWYDPEAQSAEPYDITGHGTHTMGTIAGSGGIGVAPGAKWMACKGCRSDGCHDADMLACAQFILCPTDTQGNHADCSKAPHVVSNSWSGDGGDDWFQPAVDAWVAAGIIPVFSLGNTGPGCSSASSPGDYLNVIGVTATTVTDGLARFSARGPSAFANRTKPDVTAPGTDIVSAVAASDASYATVSGSSMATPHVAGTVALMLSAQPSLTADALKRALYRTAEKKLPVNAVTCGGTAGNVWPNNQYGNGRVNALHAYSGFIPLPSPRD